MPASSTPAFGRRVIVVFAAVGALVTVGAGVLFQGNLQLRYYQYRLRLEPSFLLEIVTEPETSPQYVAVTRFLDERRARETLFQAYITHLAEEIDHRETEIHRAFTAFDGQRVWFDASYSGHKLEAGESFCEQHDVVPAIKRLLPRLEGEVFRVPGAADFEFSILTSDHAVQLYRRNAPDMEVGSVFTYRGSDPYVCRVRRSGER